MRRAALLDRHHLRGVCGDCPYEQCGGGCRGVAYAQHEDERISFPTAGGLRVASAAESNSADSATTPAQYVGDEKQQ